MANEDGPIAESIRQCRTSLCHGCFVRTTFLTFWRKPIAQLTKRYGIKKSELVVEMEFFDKAPALRGECKIGLTKNYLEGSRPNELDWFCRGGEEVY
jgi:hypothetical protein